MTQVYKVLPKPQKKMLPFLSSLNLSLFPLPGSTRIGQMLVCSGTPIRIFFAVFGAELV